ncbi:hypothetical protein AAVH_07147 [Aphelenchoides avenae]|nr:hypothetical protein AAVH_07147 [Aphelenchus avenae]
MCNLMIQYYFLDIGRIGEYFNGWTSPQKSRFVTNAICLFFKFLSELGMISLAMSIFLIASERFLATVMKKTYEQRSVVIGANLIATVYLSGAIFSGLTMVYDTVWTPTFNLQKARVSCQLDSLHPLFYMALWALGGVGFLGGASVIYSLYTYNKSRRRRNSNAALRVRYQYNENITTLDAILPAVAAYGGFYCLAFPVCLYTFIFLLNNPEIVPGSAVDWQKDTVIHFLHIVAESYGVFTCLFFMIRYRPLNQYVRQDLARWFGVRTDVFDDQKNEYKTDSDEMTKSYFQQLTDSWGGAPA